MIEEGKRLGLCAEKACEAIGITSRAIRKWRSHKDPLVDRRTKEGRKDTPRKAPANSLTPEEKAALIKRYGEPDVVNLTLNQAFYRILDSGKYFGSLSTVYRVMNEAGLNKNRNSTRAPRAGGYKPTSYEATGPNQVWTWDITYFKDSRYTGKFFYAYVIVDVFSRYVVHKAVYEADNAKYAAEFLDAAFKKHYIRPRQLVLHSDNGSSMKAASTLALLEARGVEFSHSRPRVSNDNPYSEALFKTLKYTGMVRYPTSGFESIEKAREWLKKFITKYNNEHYHCGINFVTPRSRFLGKDAALLKARKATMERERARHPNRWIQGRTMNCEPVGGVWLNPDRPAPAGAVGAASSGASEGVTVVEP